MEADIEVGWAYRLIQLFGTGRPLSFDEGCAGRSMLLRHGIPEPHIPTIAETFRSEQKGAAGVVFDRQVREQMADVGLPDTLANRERAKMEIFRAKADALLNVADRWPLIDRRQNALVASTLPEEERPRFEPDAVSTNAEAEATEHGATKTSASVIALTASIFTSEQAVSTEQPRGVVAEAAGSPPARSPFSAPEIPPETSAEIISALATPVASAASEAVGGTNLPISGLDAAYKNLARNKRDEWEPSTATDVRALVRMLADVLEERYERLASHCEPQLRRRRTRSAKDSTTNSSSDLVRRQLLPPPAPLHAESPAADPTRRPPAYDAAGSREAAGVVPPRKRRSQAI
ncbi:hypothetical protein [Aureimonas leprariae]|uniref:Uncharacterized protein n=1 Tax=Plantimonas leprariae TaxID=2615207 RepID=A0A7V7PNB2_9HYPH|nr:hypothetical protein [Aureimonas leprariae]KAB0679045.1 hypothetical protein F6X38_14200 [Aureimonas leprariae]